MILLFIYWGNHQKNYYYRKLDVLTSTNIKYIILYIKKYIYCIIYMKTNKTFKKQLEIFNKNVIFNCRLVETLNKQNELKKTIIIGFGFTKLRKTKIEKRKDYNCFCVRTGMINDDDKDGLILLDFDNNDYDAKNGLELYEYLTNNKIIDVTNNYIEKTGKNGIHVIVKSDSKFINSIGGTKTKLTVNNIKYNFDVKSNHSYSIIAPTEYKTLGDEILKYTIINDKLNYITDEMKNILYDNMKIVKEEDKKQEKYTNECKYEEKDFKHNNTDLEKLKVLVGLLDPKRLSNYTIWINLGLILKNENIDSINIYNEISKASPKYEGYEDIKKRWKSFKSTYNNKKIGLGTLISYVMEDNLEKYNIFFGKKSNVKTILEILKDNKNLVEINEKYIDNSAKEIKEVINKFINENELKTLSIKSCMNTGKTRFLIRLINNNNKIFGRILFLTHRKDFSNVMYEIYKKNNFCHYIFDKEKIYYSDRVIVTIDSLHKILDYSDESYNLIVLDEIESLLNHFSSDTLDGKNEEKYNDFLDLCKKSNKVICLDADYDERAYCFVKQLETNPMIIYNSFNNCTRVMNIHFKEYVLIDAMKKKLNNNENIVVVCQSLTKSNLLYNELITLYPNKKIILHTSETDDEIKKKLIDVNNLWKDKNIIIYTPTIESGIDYTEDTISSIFVFTSPNSNSPRSLLQMIGRIRKVKDNNIMCYMNKNFNLEINDKYLYSYNDIKETLENIDTNDIFIYNEVEENNKSPNIFFTCFKKCCEKSNMKVNIFYDELKLKEKHIVDQNIEIDNIKKICKDIDVNKIYDNVNKTEATREDKIKLDIIDLIRKIGFKKYDNIIIDNFYKDGEKHLDNLISLLNNKNNNDKQNDRNKIINLFLDKLGFKLNENIRVDHDEYIKNVSGLLERKEFKDIKPEKINILFGFKKDSKFNKDIKFFNKRTNSILFNYGLEIHRVRKKTNKKLTYTYELRYINNLNEIIINLNSLNKITKIQPYEPKENIYSEYLKTKEEISVDVFNE